MQPTLPSTSHTSSSWTEVSSCLSGRAGRLHKAQNTAQHRAPQPAAPASRCWSSWWHPDGQARCASGPGNGAAWHPECRGSSGYSPPQNRPYPARGTGGKCFWSLAACEGKETRVRCENEKAPCPCLTDCGSPQTPAQPSLALPTRLGLLLVPVKAGLLAPARAQHGKELQGALRQAV